ncbi:MAG: rhomboid family intramembrane serine protease [Anaerolineae bacterium]|nr:rhomboid family intramembrane serine protease [Anaerolineae bacterium]
MFPIGDDDVREGGVPWMTGVLIAVNVAVFFYELALFSSGQLEAFFTTYGVVPAQIAQGQNLIAFLTSMFMHGGWAHIFSNMLFLWVFGDNIETTLGKFGYLVFYLAGGIAASLVHVVFNTGAETPSLGASGAVAAVLGAYAVLYPQSRVRVLYFFFFRLMITQMVALVFIGVWFITQLFNGVASLGVPTAQTSGVAYWAHVGGFVLGLLIGFLFRGRRKPLERTSRA